MKKSDLVNEYLSAIAFATKEYEWYQTRRIGWIIASWFVRISAFFLAALGVILTFQSGPQPYSVRFLNLEFTDPAQAAVACIVIAGMIVAANQIFLITTTWTRYINAMMKIRTAKILAELDWKNFETNLPDVVPPEQIKEARAIFRPLYSKTREIVETETAGWTTEISQSITELKSLLQAQKTTLDSLAQAEKSATTQAIQNAKSPTRGIVKVVIAGNTTVLQGVYEISVGDQKVSRTAPIASPVVVSDILGGLAKVQIQKFDNGGSILIAEDVVEVKPGLSAAVTLYHLP